MPYVEDDKKIKVDLAIHDLVSNIKFYSVGQINYALSKILIAYDPQHYLDHNTLIGLLECVKLEYWRRMVVPYEEKKRQINGDIFPED